MQRRRPGVLRKGGKRRPSLRYPARKGNKARGPDFYREGKFSKGSFIIFPFFLRQSLKKKVGKKSVTKSN